jgi:hypothetical protein
LSINVDVDKQQAVCAVMLLENNDNITIRNTPTQIVIDGADYQGWGADDNYIINLILQKVGVTKL